LILRGKRFGFCLGEIRQLLDLYEIGDQQHTQFQRTYDLAQSRLQIMEKQRAELDETIHELKHLLKEARAHGTKNGWVESGDLN
jgi:DNA-binding transcriptional MerR regulator